MAFKDSLFPTLNFFCCFELKALTEYIYIYIYIYIYSVNAFSSKQQKKFKVGYHSMVGLDMRVLKKDIY